MMSNDKIWDTFVTVWEYVLWTVDHDKVTVGHCVIAVLVVLVGIHVARNLKRRLRRRLETKQNLDSSGKVALEKMTFAIMLTAVFYTALAILRIPLTVFHFAVGGLMIGFGFGARELFSNLISGIILMIERPVKIDDVVEVENEVGRVFNIGLRSFQIHTENNIDIMLPNSVVLNQKLVNWTKDDHMILTKVSIGIGYESDIKKSTELMVEAAANVKGVLKEPAPFVLFKEHGASTLNFDVYFAVNVKNKMESWVFESNVNYGLNDTLRAAGVNIAFPQLDVHLKEDVKINMETRE
ncbi:MAG: mechanosensitive ion channel [Deltaproteobacteria bacterium]|nr:mechanosensitive ion channel [Deltaproteobacteria bacterium]